MRRAVAAGVAVGLLVAAAELVTEGRAEWKLPTAAGTIAAVLAFAWG